MGSEHGYQSMPCFNIQAVSVYREKGINNNCINKMDSF